MAGPLVPSPLMSGPLMAGPLMTSPLMASSLMTPDRLFDLCREAGLIDVAVAEKARAHVRLGVDAVLALTVVGRIPRSGIWQAMAQQAKVPYVHAEALLPDLDIVRRLPPGLLQRRLALPLREADGLQPVAVATLDDDAVAAVQRSINRKCVPVISEPVVLRRAVRDALRAAGAIGLTESGAKSESGARQGISASRDESDAVALWDELLLEAYAARATDLHIEPSRRIGVAETWRVRLRVDGRLRIYHDGLILEVALPLISRIKVLGGLDIAESRAPQDGGWLATLAYPNVNEGPLRIDLRVATAPSRMGERVTVRLLGTDTAQLTIDRLGMQPSMLAAIRHGLSRPHGLILATGATGSGKSTSLYAMLRTLDSTRLNVITVEDPVEYSMEGITQCQIDHAGKLGFAEALRSFLRHDPDVLLVGEIRDRETAEVALRAALTGHLVLSTLHTNTPAEAVERLVDIGCERFLVASTLSMCIGQHLVRRLCTRCRQQRPASTELDTTIFGRSLTCTWQASGCPACDASGYRGRIAVFTGIQIDDHTREAIAAGRTAGQLMELAGEHCWHLENDLADKIEQGVITFDDARGCLGWGR